MTYTKQGAIYCVERRNKAGKLCLGYGDTWAEATLRLWELVNGY